MRLGPFLAAACFAAAPHAQAQERPQARGFGYLNPGFLLSFVDTGKEADVALGGELSYMYFWNGDQLGVGAFAQLQSYSNDHARYAFGLQLGRGIGGEIGYAYRGAHGDYAGTPAAHLALYLSTGVLEMAGRVSVPMRSTTPSGQPSTGVEGAFVLALKAPLLMHGNDDRFERMFHFMGGG